MKPERPRQDASDTAVAQVGFRRRALDRKGLAPESTGLFSSPIVCATALVLALGDNRWIGATVVTSNDTYSREDVHEGASGPLAVHQQSVMAIGEGKRVLIAATLCLADRAGRYPVATMPPAAQTKG
jgi:hypothetical protein